MILSAIVMSFEDVPKQYGLQSGTAFRNTIERAITQTNKILGKRFAHKLHNTWGPRDTGDVAVYEVRGRTSGKGSIGYVVQGTKQIFISDEGVASIQGRFGGPKTGGLAIDTEDILVLILLHEIGHIYFKDFGKASVSVPFVEADIDQSLADIRNRELKADTFAALRIREGMKSKDTDQFLSALTTAMSASSISFNLMGARALDRFAESALNSPVVFGDKTYTHPNLELRFLLMNYRITATRTGRALISTFLDRRKHPVKFGSR